MILIIITLVSHGKYCRQPSIAGIKCRSLCSGIHQQCRESDCPLMHTPQSHSQARDSPCMDNSLTHRPELTIGVVQQCIAAAHNSGVDGRHQEGNGPLLGGSVVVHAQVLSLIRPSPAPHCKSTTAIIPVQVHHLQVQHCKFHHLQVHHLDLSPALLGFEWRLRAIGWLQDSSTYWETDGLAVMLAYHCKSSTATPALQVHHWQVHHWQVHHCKSYSIAAMTKAP